MTAQDLKARADTFGSLFRSGVTPESAAAVAGLDGIEMRPNAEPITLRDK